MTTPSVSFEDWLKQASSDPAQRQLLTPRGSRYSPHAPTPRQAIGLVAHRFLPDDEPSEFLYGGAAGGGKSDWLLDGGLEYTDVPGYAAILFRRTYTDLALPGAIMSRAKQWLGTDFWNEQQKTFTFPDADPHPTLTFAYLRNDDDIYRYQSAEFQYIGFDELTQFTERQYTYLFSRLRRPEDGPLSRVPLRMRAASNPGGIGHGWVKKRFPIDGKARGRRVFIPARLDDNPHIDRAAYVKSLGQLPEVTRDQLLNGDWGTFEGQAYPEFDPTVHVLSEAMAPEIPPTWARFEQMDFGVANPTAWHLLAVDYDGNLLVLDEYYAPGLVSEHAAEILRRRQAWWCVKDEDGRPLNHPCFGDPSIAARTGGVTKLGDPASVLTEFQDHGIRIAMGNNSRRAGRIRLSELLRVDETRRAPQWATHLEGLGSPRYFVSARCPMLIDQLQTAPLLPIDSGLTDAGEVVDPKWESQWGHAVAAARYGAMSRPGASHEPEPEIEDERARRIVEHRKRLMADVKGRSRLGRIAADW